MAKGEFITKQGIEKLRFELEELVKVKRPQIAERIKEAVSFGDLAENAEYAEAKEEQAFIEGRIMEIEAILRNAMVVQPISRNPAMGVQIGCAVEILGAAKLKKMILVGKGEGNPLRGEVSCDSPIGKAVLGKMIGDVITVSTPKGNKQYKIAKIA